MVRTRRRAVLGAFGSALALPGCVGLLDDEDDATDDDFDPSQYDVESLQDGAVTAMGDVERLTFETDQELYFTDDGGPVLIDIEAEGRANEADSVTYLTSTATIEFADGGQFGVPGETYIVGDRAFLADGDGWDERVLDGVWSAAGQEVALLEGADATAVGTETVGSTVMVALELDAPAEAVATYGFDPNASPDPRPTDGTVEESTVTLYVGASAPHYVYRSDVEFTLVGEGKEFEPTFTTTFADFDTADDVELPDAIRERLDADGE